MTRVDYNVILRNNVEYVFDRLFAKNDYEMWTSAFAPGSHYEGKFGLNEIIYFYDKDRNGMKSKISKYEVNRIIEFKFIAEIMNGTENQFEQTDEFERYVFTNLQDGFVKLEIQLNMPDEYVEMMGNMWPKAIDKIIEIFDNEE